MKMWHIKQFGIAPVCKNHFPITYFIHQPESEKYDLIFDVMAPASCILDLALGGHGGHGGHGHQADRNTKRV